MTENILFPTDFSANAERALIFAAEIAERTKAKLFLFHATQDAMDMAPDFQQDRDRIIHETNDRFDELIDHLQKDYQYNNLNITTILQSGHPVSNLFEQAYVHNADMIVLGTQGANKDRSALLGSVTTTVIKKADIPVLAVPTGSSFDNFRHITFATDFKEGDLAALQQLIHFAKLFKAKVNVLHIAERKNLESEIQFRGFKEVVKKQLNYTNIDFQQEYDYDFFPAMADYLLDRPTSLLVLIKYKKSFWAKLAERNHTKEMALYSKVPLLVLPGIQQAHQRPLNPKTIITETHLGVKTSGNRPLCHPES